MPANNLLLDTHAWIWLCASPDKLSRRAKAALASKKSENLFLSVMSCWEVAKLHEKGRVKFSVSLFEWVTCAMHYPRLSILELTPQICMKSCELNSPLLRDPVDQILVATALVEKLTLVSADEIIRDCGLVQSIW